MVLVLRGSKLSTCTQRVMLVLNELGLSWDLVDINMMKGEHKAVDFVEKVHPFGRIPALEDGALHIFESKAICRYLVAKYATSDSSLILPQNAGELAIFEQAASVEYSYFEPAVFKLAYELMFKKIMGHGEPDSVAVKLYKTNLGEALDYYDRLLQKQSYLTGNEVSLVDLFHVPWLQFLPRLGMEDEITHRKYVQSWWDKLRQRASWQTILCK